MKLSHLIEGISLKKVHFSDHIICGISSDSREIKQGYIFIAIKGSIEDGNTHIEEAVKNGAIAVISEQEHMNVDSTQLVTDQIAKTTAIIAKRFYGFNNNDFRIIGITGTNGKTTTSYILKGILDKYGKTGLIGTIKHMIGDSIIEAKNTTPDSLTIYRLFEQMKNENVKYIIMEISSHGLKQKRVDGILFDSAVFTNLTQDHMDYHKTMDDYMLSKLKLFGMMKEDAHTIVNADDKYHKQFEDAYTIYHSLGLRNRKAQWTIDIKRISITGSSFVLKNEELNKSFELSINIIGDYNIYNTCFAFLSAFYMGFDADKLCSIINNSTFVVPGRFETFSSDKGVTGIVDYAHTPDALERVLKTAKRLTEGNLITVFGCGGDRDREKRPIMGKIASHYSDSVIITTDNPRFENPASIINHILSGIKERNYMIELNRKKAIEMAMRMAKHGDTVVIAGKGHETYQIINNKKHHFDDSEEIRKYL